MADLARVAYKPLPAGGGITVYYSTAFAPFREQVVSEQSPGLSELFQTVFPRFGSDITLSSRRVDATRPMRESMMMSRRESLEDDQI